MGVEVSFESGVRETRAGCPTATQRLSCEFLCID